jgi:glycosyltransferase involved in cell wall biosynthesis
MPKNLLFTSWYTGLGGGETDLLSLAQSLNRADWTSHLMLPSEGSLAEKWRELGLPVHILPYRGASTYFIPAIWQRFPIVGRIAELIQREKIDLIASEYHTLPFAHTAAKKTGIPVHWTVHGWWFRPKFWQRNFFRKIPIVARSYSIRDGFLGEPPFMPIEKLPVIYSGVDTERFSPDVDAQNLRSEFNLPSNAPLVAMIARFQPVKGQHTFQAMARQIVQQMPECHFVVAGEDTFGVAKDEAYKQQILDNAKTDPLLEKLHYIGFREDVERVLAAADVVVCASDFESYGKANIEAMACGKAVVSSNRGGPAETILDGETGYLVPAGDAEALAKRVLDLLAAPEERKRLGLNGRKRVLELFSAEKAAKAYETEFRRILENTK